MHPIKMSPLFILGSTLFMWINNVELKLHHNPSTQSPSSNEDNNIDPDCVEDNVSYWGPALKTRIVSSWKICAFWCHRVLLCSVWTFEKANKICMLKSIKARRPNKPTYISGMKYAKRLCRKGTEWRPSPGEDEIIDEVTICEDHDITPPNGCLCSRIDDRVCKAHNICISGSCIKIKYNKKKKRRPDPLMVQAAITNKLGLLSCSCSLWTSWSMCTNSCNRGERQRKRACIDSGGNECVMRKHEMEGQYCNTDKCDIIFDKPTTTPASMSIPGSTTTVASIPISTPATMPASIYISTPTTMPASISTPGPTATPAPTLVPSSEDIIFDTPTTMPDSMSTPGPTTTGAPISAPTPTTMSASKSISTSVTTAASMFTSGPIAIPAPTLVPSTEAHCSERGKKYTKGETSTCTDGCNICVCLENGKLAKTRKRCRGSVNRYPRRKKHRRSASLMSPGKVNNKIVSSCSCSFWSPWSICTKSCNGGGRQRTRNCTHSKGNKCDMNKYEVEGCNIDSCGITSMVGCVEINVAYLGGNFQSIKSHNWHNCRSRCQKHLKCHAWTFENVVNMCHLKIAIWRRQKMKHCISGKRDARKICKKVKGVETGTGVEHGFEAVLGAVPLALAEEDVGSGAGVASGARVGPGVVIGTEVEHGVGPGSGAISVALAGEDVGSGEGVESGAGYDSGIVTGTGDELRVGAGSGAVSVALTEKDAASGAGVESGAEADSVCIIEDNIDFWGISIDQKITGGIEECANWCGATYGCKIWTLNKADHRCHIKYSEFNRQPNKSIVSGTKSCGIGLDTGISSLALPTTTMASKNKSNDYTMIPVSRTFHQKLAHFSQHPSHVNKTTKSAPP